jgi:hypothetical protein
LPRSQKTAKSTNLRVELPLLVFSVAELLLEAVDALNHGL